MADILTRIEAYKREEIAAAKRARPLADIERAARAAPPPRGFLAAIARELERGLELRDGVAVELANGEGWVRHCQDRGPVGRVVLLEPVHWSDDWPIIGVDQDGVAAKRIVSSGVEQVWSKKESDGQYVVALFNTGTSGSSTVGVNWSQVGFTGSGDVTDLWSGSHKGTIADTYSGTLGPGETRLIRVKPLG